MSASCRSLALAVRRGHRHAHRADPPPAAPGSWSPASSASSLAVLFFVFGAPDVALSQIVVATRRRAADGAAHARPLRPRRGGRGVSRRARLARRRWPRSSRSARCSSRRSPGSPDFGHPPARTRRGRARPCRRAPGRRHRSGVTFDMRGIDTLGEELILFARPSARRCCCAPSAPRAGPRRPPSATSAEREPTPASLRALGAALVGAGARARRLHRRPTATSPRAAGSRAASCWPRRCCSCTPRARSWRSSRAARSTSSRSRRRCGAAALRAGRARRARVRRRRDGELPPVRHGGAAALGRHRARCSAWPSASRWPAAMTLILTEFLDQALLRGRR